MRYSIEKIHLERMVHRARISCLKTGVCVGLGAIKLFLNANIFTGTGNGGVGGVTQVGCLLYKFRGGVGKLQGYKRGRRQ